MTGYRTFILIALLGCTLCIFSASAQQKETKKRLRPFNKTEIGYYFGLEEAANNQKYNHLNLKTIIGLRTERVAFGIGLGTDNFTSSGAGKNTLNTLGFSGNIHYVFNDLSESNGNVFIKAGLGYAPRIFATYSKGYTYNGGLGYIITTKRSKRYFLQLSYNLQNIENFIGSSSGSSEIKSAGLNIGTWF